VWCSAGVEEGKEHRSQGQTSGEEYGKTAGGAGCLDGHFLVVIQVWVTLVAVIEWRDTVGDNVTREVCCRCRRLEVCSTTVMLLLL